MEHKSTAFYGASQRFPVAQIAFHLFDVQFANQAAWPAKCADAIAAL
jgi:hypothetical protein